MPKRSSKADPEYLPAGAVSADPHRTGARTRSPRRRCRRGLCHRRTARREGRIDPGIVASASRGMPGRAVAPGQPDELWAISFIAKAADGHSTTMQCQHAGRSRVSLRGRMLRGWRICFDQREQTRCTLIASRPCRTCDVDMIDADTMRPRLGVVRVNLDTGRENVVVISRRSKALRPEVFRGFSRVELRCDSKTFWRRC